MTKFAVSDARLLIVINVLIVSWLGCWQISSRLLQVAPRATDVTLDLEDGSLSEDDAGNINVTTTIHLEKSNQTLAQPNITASIHTTDPPTPPPDTITTNLPAWMQDYATWHEETRARLNETNWNLLPNRYLVMVARRGERAGGLTDRLKPLPFFLKVAARTNRILLIYWNKPFALEHYLLPPQGGLDWRVPHYMVDAVLAKPARGRKQDIVRLANATGAGMQVMICEMQASDYGQEWYDENPLNGDEQQHARLQMFRHMWHWVFTPAPPVAERVKDNFDKLGIRPGEYASAHIRAVYAVKERSEKDMTRRTHHAMNCISMLRPGGPFFVASDTAFAVKAAMEYGRSKNVTVVATTNNGAYQKQPLHLDMYDVSDPSLVPEDFYDAFVDLYLLGSTRCVAHGQGSFGHWGYLLGYNSTCEIRHHRGPKCFWTPASKTTTNQTDSSQTAMDPPLLSRPLFRPPMSYDSIYSLYA
ncbi:expressed unknown protein [Seminavis robusta]|uniref:Uncharacterized protein n=1 Tax=Seminavis robusta TaxID=568900 RepID=A0A9N8E242_9STRA|nr:expressed unknown protein [Seminavis robusta]|eukprot:Sro430_g141310.1 n/a (473) ;mRNA; r:33350-34768